MPFNSAVPIASFPAKTMSTQAVNRTKRAPLADVTESVKNRSHAVKSSPAKLRADPLPSTPDKSIASSSLLDHHHDSVQNKRHSTAEVANKRLSQIVNDSKNDSPVSSHSPREIKKLIGPWNLGVTLGEGATGRVRKARHTITGQVAAVKIMSKLEAISMRSCSVMDMDNQIQKNQAMYSNLPFGLEREIVIMKLIHHPNITKLYDLWENRGEIYLVLEYVEGGELFNYIVERGCLDERESMRIFRQLLSAVTYCHMFRVCHRDIKLENILMDKVGNIKLADFGMATREHVGGLNTACGSPHYAPPEIAAGEPYLGSQVDMWSCGVVLYIMLIGELPFGQNLQPNDIDGILSEVANKIPEFSFDLDSLALDLLIRLLEKAPSVRITTEEIWDHSLLQKYEKIAQQVDDPERWIGGRPRPLTTKDCGVAVKRSEIEKDLLSGVCTLWHCVKSEEMIEQLTNDKPNYEKVIYKNLLSFRTEQEEKYYGTDLDYADSDVHHIQRRLNRTMSNADLLGSIPRPPSMISNGMAQRSMVSRPSIARGSQARLRSVSKHTMAKDPYKSSTPHSGSRYTIASPPPRQTGSKYSIVSLPPRKSASKQSIVPRSAPASRHPSQKSHSTERSYDPFRASSSGAPPKPANYANTKAIGNSSLSSRYGYASYAASQRRPASYNPQSPGSSVVNSVHSVAKDHMGNRRSLRRSQLIRENSDSSWASTRMSTSSSIRQFPVSIRRRRTVHMSAPQKRSPPPARPRHPTPMTMQQHYRQDSPPKRSSPVGVPPAIVITKQAPAAQEKLHKDFNLAPPGDVNRTSALWEERTRKASLELSTLMDEVFSETDIDTALWDEDTEEKRQEEFIRRSFDLPALRDTGFQPRPPIKKAELLPPVDEPSKLRSIYDADSVEELTRMKDRLETRARDLGTNSLDPIIGHLTRLLQDKPNSRRIASAPQPSRANARAVSLSPVKEEEEPRHVSSPVKSKNGRMEKSGFRGNQSTIRLVTEDNDPLYPSPLKIKKKPSVVLLNAANPDEDNQDPRIQKVSQGRLKMGVSTATLDKLFKKDANKSGILNKSLPIAPDQSPPSSPRAAPSLKRDSGDNKTKNWFRRSHISLSNHSTTDSESQTSETRGEHPRSNTNTSSEEFTFRLPKRESAASKVIRFFKGQPKEKRMQIAIPDELSDEWYDSPPKIKAFYAGSRRRTNSRMTLGSDTSLHANRRDSQYARLSSPHLFNAAQAHEPYPTASNGPINLFARLFNLPMRQSAPSPQLFCLQLQRSSAINEIKIILRDWRVYGLCNVRSNMKAGTIRATVSENNSLGMQPVTLFATVHAVAVDGNAGGLSIVKIIAEWGNRNSFTKACNALGGVLRGRNLVVRERHVAGEMKTALREWERL